MQWPGFKDQPRGSIASSGSPSRSAINDFLLFNGRRFGSFLVVFGNLSGERDSVPTAFGSEDGRIGVGSGWIGC